MWVAAQGVDSLGRFDNGAAIFGVYVYLIFYAAFVLIPYGTLTAWASLGTTARSRVPAFAANRRLRTVTALWAGVTFALFWRPIFAFLRAVPETWNGWLVILWIVSTVWLIVRYRTA